VEPLTAWHLRRQLLRRRKTSGKIRGARGPHVRRLGSGNAAAYHGSHENLFRTVLYGSRSNRTVQALAGLWGIAAT
jgi:hypothetical protein